MFFEEIQIRTQDGHTIYDESTKEVLNKGGDVIFGDHVWLSRNVFIFKMFINFR